MCAQTSLGIEGRFFCLLDLFVISMPIRPENKKLYPSNWKQISKSIRFGRANNKCEFCKAENYKPHPLTGSKVVLTVAHLDHNPANCQDENLKALCQKCHNTYDAPMRKKGKYDRKYCNQLKLFDI